MITRIYEGNLFLLPKSETEAAVVTTNGVLKRDGRLVMGAGIAKYCRDRYTGIDEVLGRLVAADGNIAFFVGQWYDPLRDRARLDPMVNVVSCPTKHHFKDGSDLRLIKQSCHAMYRIACEHRLTRVYIPALGCALGGLDWTTQVEPICSAILDDRFVAAIPASMVSNPG